jgi:hypothetical protein
LHDRLTEHLTMVEAERARAFPNEGVIRHWEKEMRAFQTGISRARKRLRRKT